MLRRVMTMWLFLMALAVPGRAIAQSAPATAPAPQWGYGVRAGLSFSPDQFVIGGHLESPDLAQQFLSRLTFRPTFEIGVGNDQTRVMTHLEFALWAPIPQSPWSAYVVAGPGIEFGEGTGGVVTFGVGFQHQRGYFAELKYLSGEARIVAGYVFSKR